MNRKNFIKNILLAAPATILAGSSGELYSKSKEGSAGKVRAGFSKSSLVPVIQSSVAFRRELESTCAVIKDPYTRIALIALDLIEITPQTNMSLQKRISEETGFQVENILIHTTHTHASPWDSREENTMKGLGDLLAGLVQEADRKAVPAKIRTGNKDVAKSLSFQRIGYTGKELGYQSFWYGFQYRNGDGRADASALVNEMKARWMGEEGNYEAGKDPVWFNREVDPLVQAVAFEDMKGKTIGSIVRFSAHAGPADACKNRMYDPDFMAVARDDMEAGLGGISMYLSGPLGNLAPKVHLSYEIDPKIKLPDSYLGPTWAIVASDEKEALAERDRIGHEIAGAALDCLKGKKAVEISDFGFRTKLHPHALDPNLPKSHEEIERFRTMLQSEYQAFKRSGKSLSEVRLLANRLNWLEWSSQFIGLVSPEERERGSIDLPLSVLNINNNYMAFMHSETMAETSLALRASLPNVEVISVCLTGGSMQYIPTAEIQNIGGYEGRASIIGYNVEADVRETLLKMINK